MGPRAAPPRLREGPARSGRSGGQARRSIRKLLAQFPEGYRHLAYLQTKIGYKVKTRHARARRAGARRALRQGRGLAEGQEAVATSGLAITARSATTRSIAGVQSGGIMSFADKFNLLNEFNILRLICGLFFIPHIVGKFTVPATLGFFVAAGLQAAEDLDVSSPAPSRPCWRSASFSASTPTYVAADRLSSICWSPAAATYKVKNAGSG